MAANHGNAAAQRLEDGSLRGRRAAAFLRRLAPVGKAVLTCACAALAAAGSGFAEVAAPEEQVRAAFLYQLAQYVDWPAGSFDSQTSAIRFCSLGADDLTGTLTAIVRGKHIDGRAIEVVTVRDTGQLPGCHVAYIGFTREKKLRETFAAWSYAPVLLVGQANRFAELGGMVNLVIDSGRVSFEINVSTAGRARLQFRSQLLRLARIVSQKEGGQ